MKPQWMFFLRGTWITEPNFMVTYPKTVLPEYRPLKPPTPQSRLLLIWHHDMMWDKLWDCYQALSSCAPEPRRSNKNNGNCYRQDRCCYMVYLLNMAATAQQNQYIVLCAAWCSFRKKKKEKAHFLIGAQRRFWLNPKYHMKWPESRLTRTRNTCAWSKIQENPTPRVDNSVN